MPYLHGYGRVSTSIASCRIAPAGTPDTNGGSEDDSGRAGIDRRKRSGQNQENGGRRRTLNDT
jgi:hypothetical protein